MKFVLVSIFQILILASKADGELALNSLVEIQPYAVDGPKWNCSNYAENWYLRFRGGEIVAEQKSNSGVGDKITITIGSSNFIGHDKGEFGGMLEVVSEGKKTKLFSSNIQFIFLLPNGKVGAIGGVNHMGTDKGWYLLISKDSNSKKWIIEKETKLDECPQAVTYQGDSVYYVSSKGIGEINVKNSEPSLIYQKSYRGLYPESILIDENHNVYVGMRHAIAKLIFNKSSKKFDERWLVKNDCIKLKDGNPVFKDLKR